MEEFLKTLYKVFAAEDDADGLDLIFQVFPKLLEPSKFEEASKFLATIDLSKVSVAAMLCLVNMTSQYRIQLPNWDSFYRRCREESARRKETEEEVERIFGHYATINEKELYDPNKAPNKSHEQRHNDLIESKIALARQLGDEDLSKLLEYYRAMRQDSENKSRKFRELRFTCGDEVLRERCIKSLREIADKLEQSAGSWPGIYYCDLPENPLLKNTFIDGINVVISYPWPG
jgi:hypothetical protein